MQSELYKLIDSYRDDMLEDLRGFIAIPSCSKDLPKVREALDYGLDLGRRMGLHSYSVLDRQVGLIELGDGEEMLGILTHVDVVPPGDAEDWNTPPFDMIIQDGRAYGRGTLDDKGMIIASLYAMKAVKSLGVPLFKKTQLIMGTQEEVEWTDMDEYILRYPLPDYGFTPDGEYPICNIEKGVIDVTMTFDVREDTPSDLPYIESCDIGVATNTVPGRASCTLSDGRTISAVGRSIHACQPENGVNAIFELTKELSEMDIADTKVFRLFKAISKDLSDCFGKPIGLYSESEYYEGEFVHRNALSPTILKTDGKTAELNVNLRYPYGASEKDIVKAFSDWAAPLGGTVIKTNGLHAVFVSQKKPFLKAFAKAYENVTGLKNEFTLAYGGSYAKAMPNIVSWGPLFPDEVDTCHEPNEYINIDSLIASAKIFAESIFEIATKETSFK
ncbi:MAG: Sapep family Mn(2+)-dependent dipeptidase [Clostridia bacterium]|nr:Sapep family Mn(2+)-dependent dipeptidase [Clostridia bacterium]